jgi:hypothetical protein
MLARWDLHAAFPFPVLTTPTSVSAGRRHNRTFVVGLERVGLAVRAAVLGDSEPSVAAEEHASGWVLAPLLHHGK